MQRTITIIISGHLAPSRTGWELMSREKGQPCQRSMRKYSPASCPRRRNHISRFKCSTWSKISSIGVVSSGAGGESLLPHKNRAKVCIVCLWHSNHWKCKILGYLLGSVQKCWYERVANKKTAKPPTCER